jgi:hypothetical protein
MSSLTKKILAVVASAALDMAHDASKKATAQAVAGIHKKLEQHKTRAKKHLANWAKNTKTTP